MMDAAWSEVLPRTAEWHTAPAVHTSAGEPRRGKHGERLWPNGIVGSITYAGGLRTMVTAPAHRVRSLGIDMEPLAPLPPSIWPRFLEASELDELLDLPVPQRGIAALSRWCIKEALFKALHGRIPLDTLPLTGSGDICRPAPKLQTALHELEMHLPEHLVLRSTARDGWLCAAAWVLQPTEHCEKSRHVHLIFPHRSFHIAHAKCSANNADFRAPP